MKNTLKKCTDALTRYKIIALLLIIVAMFVGFGAIKSATTAEGTYENYVVPFDQITHTLRLKHPASGNVTTDSLLVINASGRWVRKIAPLSTQLTPYATTASLSGYATNSALSSYASLSATYGNPSWITSLAYSKITGAPSATTYTSGTGVAITSGVISNTAPDQTVTLTSGNRIAITGTYPNFTISYIEPSPTIVTRTVNTNYTISTTKRATVIYTITVTATNPLLAGSSAGNAYLEYSLNAGTTWNSPSQIGNSNAVGVAVAIALTNGQTVGLGGTIPANALVRIRTTIAGTSTATFVAGQEAY